MNCRQCGIELVPNMVSDLGSDKKYQWKSAGELAYECPAGCRLNQCETASKQEAMREKPTPRLPRSEEVWGRR